ncbi:MAG: hypothetical protein LC800_07800 [Acidobacteria bacterium]|nr:hypothetical protein [Acidobacteriota bacterium]
MSRLNYAPKLGEIEITDIKRGLGVFAPKPGKPVSFDALKAALKKAGYALDSAEITVSGVLEREGRSWRLAAAGTGQRFALEGADVEGRVSGFAPGEAVEIRGEWKTTGKGAAARETVVPLDVSRPGASRKASRANGEGNAPDAPAVSPAVSFVAASLVTSRDIPVWGSVVEPPAGPPEPPAPIRVTSPGLTVYKGGAVTPRLFLISQRLGGLEVSRQVFQLSVSYTPSPRTQFEIEVPVSRTSYDDGASEGSGFGPGNVTLWGKYRFFRTVKTYGDRQASLRLGLELPTGKGDAPTAREVNAPAFVRQQLTPISGGLAPHADLSFSQAGGRFIFGGNVEGVLRSERDGFRTGHELRVNTDLEYVLLPRSYDTPGGELFVILETSFIYRGTGRLGGAAVSGSKSTEYYVAPGLQYAAHPRFVVEGSLQLPVVRNTGPLVLRNDSNLLLGVKYLF